MSKYNKKKVELNMLQDMHYDALILYRVEQWLKNEVESNQDVADAKDNKEDSITSDGTDDIIYGRHECANSLSEQISTWRKELRGLEQNTNGHLPAKGSLPFAHWKTWGQVSDTILDNAYPHFFQQTLSSQTQPSDILSGGFFFVFFFENKKVPYNFLDAGTGVPRFQPKKRASEEAQLN